MVIHQVAETRSLFVKAPTSVMNSGSNIISVMQRHFCLHSKEKYSVYKTMTAKGMPRSNAKTFHNEVYLAKKTVNCLRVTSEIF